MQSIRISQAFDRGDFLACDLAYGRDTGSLGNAIDQNSARAALSFAAAIFGTRKVEFVPKNEKERTLRIDGHVRLCTVYQEIHEFILNLYLAIAVALRPVTSYNRTMRPFFFGARF